MHVYTFMSTTFVYMSAHTHTHTQTTGTHCHAECMCILLRSHLHTCPHTHTHAHTHTHTYTHILVHTPLCTCIVSSFVYTQCHGRRQGGAGGGGLSAASICMRHEDLVINTFFTYTVHVKYLTVECVYACRHYLPCMVSKELIKPIHACN